MKRSLSVIIPTYNSAKFIENTVNHVKTALLNSGLDYSEIIIIDDGSTDDLDRVISTLSSPELQIVKQENQGRLLARQSGLKVAQYEYSLLIDSRVLIMPDSLLNVLPRDSTYGESVISGPCRFPDDATLLELFWDGVTRFVWYRYHRSPSRTLLTAENFNKLPKGTTCVLVPTKEMLDATKILIGSGTLDAHLMNDDTPILRQLCSKVEFWVDPGLDAIYLPRSSLIPFAKHALHRGRVFVNGFMPELSRIARLSVLSSIVLAIVVSMFVAIVDLYNALVIAGAVISFFLITALCRKVPIKSAISVILLCPVFLLSFGSGFVQSLVKTLRP